MREIMIGDTQISVKASALTLLFYKQEFKTDLLGDLVSLAKAQDDISKLDTVALLQLVWSMAKSAAFDGKAFPSFATWLSAFESIDISDPAFMQAAIEEAASGLFRSGTKGQ